MLDFRSSSSVSWTQYIGVGVGGGRGWGAEGWFFHALEQKAAIVCSWKYRKEEHSVPVRPRSSFTPSVVLLVHPSGTVHPTVVGLQDHLHDASKSRP